MKYLHQYALKSQLRVVIRTVLICLQTVSFAAVSAQSDVLQLEESLVEFVSSAPLESISASTRSSEGVLDPSSGQFAIKIVMSSFEGFNNALQRIHFLENYIEIRQHPEAIFIGSLVEEINYDKEAYGADQMLHAKGRLQIHGMTKTVMIPIQVVNREDGLHFNGDFSIELKDYDIHIPKIVDQKIAKNIEIKLSGVFIRSNKS